MSRTGVVGIVLLGLAASASAVSIPGGGSKRNDCAVALQADGLAFPAGNERPKGTSCADGGPCDADGTIDGACEFLVAFCLNVDTPSDCGPSEVSAITVKKGTLKGGGSLDVTGLQAVAGGKSTGEVARCVSVSGALLQKQQGHWHPVKAKEGIPAGTLLVALPKAELQSGVASNAALGGACNRALDVCWRMRLTLSQFADRPVGDRMVRP